MSTEAGNPSSTNHEKDVNAFNIPETPHEGFASSVPDSAEKAGWDQAKAEVRDRYDTADTTESKSSKKGLFIGLGTGAAALAIAAGAFTLGRGSSDAPKPRPGASGTPTPGPSASETGEPTPNSTPTTSETEVVGVAERQNRLYENASITPEMLSPDFFEKFTVKEINPSAINIYRGDGERGLFKDFDDTRRAHERIVANISADDIRAYQDRVDAIMSGDYTKIVDGEPVRGLKANEIFTNGGYLGLFNEDALTSTIDEPAFGLDTPKEQASYLANLLATVDQVNVRGAIVSALEIERGIEEYNVIHGDDQVPPNMIEDYIPLAQAVAENRFLKVNGDATQEAITSTINTAESNIAMPIEDKAYIVNSYSDDIKSDDGTATFHREAISIFYETEAGTMVYKTLVPVHINRGIVVDPLGNKIKDTQNSFVFVNVAQTSKSAK